MRTDKRLVMTLWGRKTKRPLVVLLLLFILIPSSLAVLPDEASAFSAKASLTPTRRARTPTQTPTRTITPTKTSTPDVLANTSINTLTPKDVLSEVSFWLGGGGGGDSYCIEKPASPRIAIAKNIEIDVLEAVAFGSCGWEKDELLSITIRNTQRKAFEKKEKAALLFGNDFYAQRTLFQPGPGAPTGKYTITIKGKNATVTGAFMVTKKPGARMYVVSNDPFNPPIWPLERPFQLMLTGFKPNEPVRILIYTIRIDQERALLGWKDIKVKQDGTYVFNVAANFSDNVMILAAGKTTGTVYIVQLDYEGFDYSENFNQSRSYYCPGSLPTRLANADFFIVSHTDGTNLRIREKPGFTSKVIKQVKEGSFLERSDYYSEKESPQCVDNVYWWIVQLDDVTTGWAAESTQGKYLLEPGKK